MGVKVASKQASLLMHMEYKVTLQDQNYVIAPQCKLILTANGDMRIQEKDFSGDAMTFLVLRTVPYKARNILVPVPNTNCKI